MKFKKSCVQSLIYPNPIPTKHKKAIRIVFQKPSVINKIAKIRNKRKPIMRHLYALKKFANVSTAAWFDW